MAEADEFAKGAKHLLRVTGEVVDAMTKLPDEKSRLRVMAAVCTMLSEYDKVDVILQRLRALEAQELKELDNG